MSDENREKGKQFLGKYSINAKNIAIKTQSNPRYAEEGWMRGHSSWQ